MKHEKIGVGLRSCGSFSGTAHAQGFPSKEVRFINGFPAGGTSDIIGRLLAEQFSRQLGKSVVVDNKAGASGMIAAAETAKSAPDGHTILLASMAMMTVLPQMVKTSIDVDKDLTTIGNVASVYNILVVGRDTPYQNWQDVEKAAKANPEKVTCAYRRLGLEPEQLSCALFMALTGDQAHAGALSRRRAGDRRHDRRPRRPRCGATCPSSWARSAAAACARSATAPTSASPAAARGAGDFQDRR